MPREDGLGGAVADVGRTTVETGSRIWDRTLYLLGFGDAADYERQGAAERNRLAARDDALLDEVDLALMKEDAVMPSPDAVDVVLSPAWADTAAGDGVALTDDELFDGERVLVESAFDGEPVSNSDLTHEVGASETLWDIAKMTTGDATNWHVLADVNDLAPDAAVYPGQTLVVPADLVRPEFAGFTTTADATAADDGTGDRLAIPGTATETGTDALELEVAGSATEALEPDAAAAAPTGGTELRLGAGETLWDFSRRTTGDATNWRAIADANGFSEEKATRVYENMRITVPTALLRDDKPIDGAPAATATASATAPLDATATDDVSADGTTRDPLVPIADAADVEAETAAAADESEEALAETDPNRPIRIVEAAYRTEPDELAGDAAVTGAGVDAATDVVAGATAGITTDVAASAAADAVADSAPQEIMVSGTYYPKAVYNDADFSSSLLMRVSPGTTLQVSRAVGSWYEVATDQGTGYMHARDIK